MSNKQTVPLIQFAFCYFRYMKWFTSLVSIIMIMLPTFGKSQNPIGFETMVNAILSGTIDTISSVKLDQKMKANEVFVLDTREKREYDVSHLRGSRYVGYDDFSMTRVADIDHNSTIVVYCSIGKRSEEIALKLKQAGYLNVLNHWGGIFDWTNRGFDVVDLQNDVVKVVHPYSATWGIWINNCEKSYEPR